MRKAFSLIELLLVIAIAGIILSLLIPAIGNVQSASQSSVCKNNQRQLALAAAAYRNAHQQNPPAFTEQFESWDDKSILWQYVDQPHERLACPQHIHNTYSETGYNYNTSFIGSEAYVSGIVVHGVDTSTCKHPSHCAMFGDSSKNKFMRSPQSDEQYDPYTDPYTRCAGMQSFRHDGGTVVAWLDGHVSIRTSSFNTCNDDATSGFLSEENELYDPRSLVLP